eukprot:gene11653-11798_t
MGLRCGIDVGGTHTDAVLLSVANTVVATAKVKTSSNVVSGIVAVLDKLAPDGLSSSNVSAVMIGSTQFVNALVQGTQLSKVFVIRLCGTSAMALPPFLGMPANLLQQIAGGYLLADGGFEYDGRSVICATNPADAVTAAEAMLCCGAQAAVVCGVHATVNPQQEEEFAALLQERLSQRNTFHITLSHKLSGRLGLLEREAAAILNAALQPLAAKVLPSYAAALAERGLGQECPLLTFRSGPVNSVRGAAFLAADDLAADSALTGLVMDIGGTTTDVGAVVQGNLKMSGTFVDICGVTTVFQMPEDSCLVCGGSIFTATDVAVLLHDLFPSLASRQAAQAMQPSATTGNTPDHHDLATAWQVIQDSGTSGGTSCGSGSSCCATAVATMAAEVVAPSSKTAGPARHQQQLHHPLEQQNSSPVMPAAAPDVFHSVSGAAEFLTRRCSILVPDLLQYRPFVNSQGYWEVSSMDLDALALGAQVGGGNGLEPLAVGLELGLPVVDADLMGRAFPELQMSTAAIAGVPLAPAAIADDKGNVVVMPSAASAVCVEKVFSLAWHLGMRLITARAAKTDPVAAVLQLYQGAARLLLTGKVVDVQRDTKDGFVTGHVK